MLEPIKRLVFKQYRLGFGSKSVQTKNFKKIGIHSFLARRLSLKRVRVMPPLCVVDKWQIDSNITKASSLSPGQGNVLLNEDAMTLR